MKRVLFIGGIDTNCGKTMTCCALSNYFSEKKMTVKYLKPFQTGPQSEWDGNTLIKFGGAPLKSDPYFWTHPHPGAPYECVKFYKGDPVQWNHLTDWLQNQIQKTEEDLILIEGCGGLNVPITASQTLMELIKTFPHMETLLVSHLKLGTLNHTHQSLNTIRALPNPFQGVIYFGEGNDHNISMIETLYKAPTVGRSWFKNNRVLFEGLL
jgi:dethiobiotin synthetase